MRAYYSERTPAMDRTRKKGAPEDRGAPKQAASPAQEATRARIAGLESQLRKLKAAGARLDQKTNFQVRCLEEDLRKAHSKLRRLLNEAERQRRRRERLRGGLTTIPYEPPRDDAVMSTLKSCTRFQDLVRELNILGFTITQNDDFTDDGESMPEVDGVKVEVELIEGEEELETDFKTENTSSSSCSEIPSLLAADEDDDPDRCKNKESYRRWFERQTEMQQRWEENFMREQMELTRLLLESITSTFLQGVQQILSNLNTGRRFPPHSPDPPTL